MQLEQVRGMNQQGRRAARRGRLATAALLFAAVTAPPGRGVAADLPTTLDVPSVTVQKAPARFKFQARVSQGGNPVGRARFPNVYVKVRDNTSGFTCTEQFAGVEVRSSVMNLTIGDKLVCGGAGLDELLRDSNGLQLTVCINSEATCLQPIDIGAVPFATKSTFAHHATEAERANVAAQAHYAHRVTADAAMLGGATTVGKGYFDFWTPGAGGAAFTPADFSRYAQGGFIQWAPVRVTPGGGAPATLAICAKERLADGTDGLAPLAELALVSATTRTTGNVAVGRDATVAGELTVGRAATVGETLTVFQNASVGSIEVSGAATIGGPLSVTSATTLDGTLQVASGTTLNGALHVEGAATLKRGLSVTQGTATTGLAVDGNASIERGLLVAANGVLPASSSGRGLAVADGAQVDGGLSVAGGGATTLDVTGRASVSQGLAVRQGAAANALAVTGAATFDGDASSTGAPSTLACSMPATFSKATIFGVAGAPNGTTMTVHAATTHEGTVALNGSTTTRFPIPGVVAPNDVDTDHIKEKAVTSAKLAVVPANVTTGARLGETPGYFFCSAADAPLDSPITGEWQFCALTDVQIMSAGGGRCKLTARAGTQARRYVYTLRTIMTNTCCAVSCF